MWWLFHKPAVRTKFYIYVFIVDELVVRTKILNSVPNHFVGSPLSPNCIGGVMVSVLASSAVDCGFEPWSGQTKDYEIGICCLSAKHTALWRKSKDRLVRNQDNVSEWGYMSTRGLLFQWASTIKIQLSVLV